MSAVNKTINENSNATIVSQQELEAVAEKALAYARQQGMDQAQVDISNSVGRSVAVRKQDLESVEIHNDRSLVVSVFTNQQTGSASSADFTEVGIEQTVAAAVAIAKQTARDDCFGLADAALMATEQPDLQLFHDWDIAMPAMTELAQECEQAALDVDARVSNTEGATVNSHSGVSVYANSHGFVGFQRGSRHSLSCSVIAGQDADMQRDYWYTSNCDPTGLNSAATVGKLAGDRAIRRLGAKQIDSCQVPVLFEAPLAGSLISHLLSAIKGGVLYKKASFLLDQLDQQVLPDWLSVVEQPHLVGGVNSAAFDAEGVATPARRAIVQDGVLQNYLLGSYTARKLGMQSTANAGGTRNVTISNTGQSFDELLKTMGEGLLVTELIGSGINMVTGDYSRGASGFWVKNGVIQHAVQEVTIAGNLRDMFMRIIAAGQDIDARGNIQTGSILLDEMTVAGA